MAAGRIKGSGSNAEFGQYRFSGTESRFAATLSYGGERDQENLVGVVILVLTGEARTLSGVWWQYGADGTLMGDKVTWRRLP